VSEVFLHKDEIRWADRIVKGILETDSPWVSDIGRAMEKDLLLEKIMRSDRINLTCLLSRFMLL